MLRDESGRLGKVVVCSPRYEYSRASSDLKRHNIGVLGSPEMAISQHNTLKTALRKFGAEVIDAPELVDHPNSVFTRDTALCTPRGYIKLRLGLESRQGEEEWMACILDELGETCAGKIEAPGTVEGGDVVLAGSAAFIGHSIRTNEEGVRQLSRILRKMGYKIRVIELPETILHLDKVLMVLGSGKLLYCSEFVSERDIAGYYGIDVHCGGETTANIICLGDDELIINKSNFDVIARLEAENFFIHDLNLSEFAKGMGGPNCLIMPVERLS
jgi:dimethylargininase